MISPQIGATSPAKRLLKLIHATQREIFWLRLAKPRFSAALLLGPAWWLSASRSIAPPRPRISFSVRRRSLYNQSAGPAAKLRSSMWDAGERLARRPVERFAGPMIRTEAASDAAQSKSPFLGGGRSRRCGICLFKVLTVKRCSVPRGPIRGSSNSGMTSYRSRHKFRFLRRLYGMDRE